MAYRSFNRYPLILKADLSTVNSCFFVDTLSSLSIIDVLLMKRYSSVSTRKTDDFFSKNSLLTDFFIRQQLVVKERLIYLLTIVINTYRHYIRYPI